MSLWSRPVPIFIDTLRKAGLRRAAVVYDHARGCTRSSNPVLAPLVEALEHDRRDYDAHDGLFFEVGRESGHLLYAALHRTIRGQGAGGVRFWSYGSLEEFVRDGLRLSRGMGQKCALAGLWWGGGKGVIARHPDHDHRDPAVRRAVFEDYGRFISGLRGCYVTAEDVGTTPADMLHIHATTRFTTCVPEALGGSGNPSRATAAGVVVAMEAALAHRGSGTLAGKHVAMQGLGNVAGFMVAELFEREVAKITAVDIDEERVANLKQAIGDERLLARAVAPGDDAILAEPCDLLAPNAVGGILHPATIGEVQAPIICGAANNQLRDPDRDSRRLAEKGVLFVPDFLANRMGIVNCANEQYGWIPADPAIERHLDRDYQAGIYRRTLEVLTRSERNGSTAWAEALELADELSGEPHPLWGERTRRIITHLMDSGWATG